MLSNQEERNQHFIDTKERILKSYGVSEPVKATTKTATTIVKSDFEKAYPLDKFEVYSLQALDRFRKNIEKSEDIEDKKDAFLKATNDLKSFVVYGEGEKAILFVREKKQ